MNYLHQKGTFTEEHVLKLAVRKSRQLFSKNLQLLMISSRRRGSPEQTVQFLGDEGGGVVQGTPPHGPSIQLQISITRTKDTIAFRTMTFVLLSKFETYLSNVSNVKHEQDSHMKQRVGNRERGCWTFFFVFGRCDFAVIACRNGSNCCAEFRFG
jgi:hypothetical protein